MIRERSRGRRIIGWEGYRSSSRWAISRK